jgi:uncharacterized glyoxalase superfamily protein PhnB
VTPRIVASDAKGLVDFIKRVFEASGAFEAQRPSEVRIGDSLVMISEAGERPPMPAFLYVYVADVDATLARARASGARVLEEASVMPYGDRRCMFEDRWGNTWQAASRSGSP